MDLSYSKLDQVLNSVNTHSCYGTICPALRLCLGSIYQSHTGTTGIEKSVRNLNNVYSIAVIGLRAVKYKNKVSFFSKHGSILPGCEPSSVTLNLNFP